MKKLVIIALIALAAQSTVVAKHNKRHDKKCDKSCEVKCGPNHNQAAPCLKRAKLHGCNLLVEGSLQGVPDAEYVVQVYCCGSVLGNKSVHTDVHGSASFVASVSTSCPCSAQQTCSAKCACPQKCKEVSAVATRMRDGEPAESSAMSKSVKVCR